jgi:hypothetical protein
VPYIYTKADELEGTELVGTHQCVALIQHYAKAPVSSAWRQGEHAVDATALLTEVSSRFIPCRGKTKNGAYIRASDNADAFYVIE